MKHTNNKNSEHKTNENHGSSKEQYDDLWLTLEPRLKKPKRKKWMLLFGLLIGLFFIGSLGWLALNNTNIINIL